jgi:(2Fe-2S) ferredoxin
MMENININPKLHVFICVNDRSNFGTASCSPTITLEMFKEVKQWINRNGLASTIFCTKTKCLGFCNPEGGVMCVWPSGRFVKGLINVDEIKQVINEEFDKL